MSHGYFTFDGDDGLACSDSVGLSIADDIDIIILVAPDDATPPGFEQFMGKSGGGGSNRSYRLGLVQSGDPGELRAHLSDDGSTAQQIQSTAAISVADGNWTWLRFVFDASEWEARFYEATTTDNDTRAPSDSGITWSQLGVARTGTGPFTIHDSSEDLTIGVRGTATSFFNGKVAGLWIYEGIPVTWGDPPNGTLRANPDFRDTVQGDWSSLPVSDDQGNSWSANAGAPVYTAPTSEKPPPAKRLYVPRRSLTRRHQQVVS